MFQARSDLQQVVTLTVRSLLRAYRSSEPLFLNPVSDYNYCVFAMMNLYNLILISYMSNMDCKYLNSTFSILRKIFFFAQYVNNKYQS